MAQEAAHVHLVDPNDPTVHVDVSKGAASPTDCGLVVHIASQPSAAPGAVALDAATLAALETIQVGNFPATQPISGSVAVSNLPATQPVSGTVAVSNLTPAVETGLAKNTTLTDGTQKTQVTNFPATQPVSGTVTASQGGPPWTVNLTQIGGAALTLGQKTMAASMPVALASDQGPVTITGPAVTPANLAVTATGAAAAAVILTLPAAGAGLFHYLNSFEITAYSTAARTGVAAPIIVTSTNLPGTPAWTFATAAAIGTTDRYMPTGTEPIKSSAANTATTIVCPATASIIWRVNISYFAGA